MIDPTIRYVPKPDWEEKKAKDKDAMVYLSRSLLIRLTDSNKNPLPLAKCRIIGDADSIIECDENGVAHIPVPSGNPSGIDLEWEPQDAAMNDATNRFYFKGSFDLNVASKNDKECATRLANLGFIGGTLAEQVNAYQSYFGRVPTGTLNDIRNEMVAWHDGGNYPGQTEAHPDKSAMNESIIEYSKVKVLLCDPYGNPILQSQWYATVAGTELSGTTSNGQIEIDNPDKLPTIKLKWNDQNGNSDFFYEQELLLVSENSPDSLYKRLQNLGYFGITLEDKLLSYLQDFNYSCKVADESVYDEIIAWHDGESSMPVDKA